MNYICFEIENGGFIDFSLFDGADEAPYDDYIGLYLQVKRLSDGCMVNQEWREDLARAKELLDQMDDMDIYHPFAQVERLRLAMKENNQDEVREYLEILSAQNTRNSYVRIQCGAALEYFGSLGRGPRDL